MKYLETKHEKKSVKITTIIVVILVLLCFVVGQDYQDPPEEYGVAINFGDASVISDNVKPDNSENAKEIESEPEETEAEIEEEIVKDEVAEEVIEETTDQEIDKQAEEKLAEEKAAQEALEAAEEQAAAEAEKLLAQQEEEALKIKNEKEAKEAQEAKEKAAAKKLAEAKAKADKAAKDAEAKAAADAKAKAQKEAAAKAAADKAASDKAARDAKTAAATKANSKGGGSVKFDVIENAPIYPGCKSGNNESRKKCMNAKIKQFLNQNFNKILASDLGLNGKQKIYIRFTISETGSIVGIRAKAEHDKLEGEAKRVVGLLPKMKPGMQQGRPAAVSFDLPILINMNE